MSGESGAGKTETTKHTIQYLVARAAGGGAESQLCALSAAVHESAHVTEAFGNAKTARNDNSSRFGKLLQVFCDPGSGAVRAASIRTYLLERTRVTQLAPQVRWIDGQIDTWRDTFASSIP